MALLISSIDALQAAFDDLYRKLNENIIHQGDGRMLTKIRSSGDAEGELKKALVDLCRQFVDVFDHLIDESEARGETGFDFGRDWESAVRALADIAAKDAMGERINYDKISLFDLIKSAHDDFEATFSLVVTGSADSDSAVGGRLGINSPPDVAGNARSSSNSNKRSTKALLHCILLETGRLLKNADETIHRLLKQDLTEFHGDSRVYFATSNAIMALTETTDPDISIIRQGQAFARSALKRSPYTPGLHHLCALYDMYLGVRELRLSEESRDALFTRAREQSTEAIDLNPTYHRYWATRAEAYRLLRDRERAKRDLRSAVDLLKYDPRHPEHSPEYKETLGRYNALFARIRQDDEMHTILDMTTEQQRSLRQMIGEVESARDTLEAKTQELSQNFEQLQLTLNRIEADASANRREQIQLVAIVAAFIGLIASTVPVVGAGASRVEASGGGISDLLLLLSIPAVLIVVLIVTLNLTFRRQTSKPDRRSRRWSLRSPVSREP